MRFLLRLYRDPNAAPEATGSPMLDAMNEAEAAASTAPVVDKTTETNETAPKTKFAWGDDDRRKTRAELKDDDEIDLGYEDEKDGVKSPAKAKLSNIRQTAKWLKDNTNLINSAIGMNKQFKDNPELFKAFNTFWEKAFDGNKYNPEAVTKMMTVLEGKAEVISDKITDNADDIAEAEKELLELDQDSPQYKIAKRSLNALRALGSQLKASQDSNKTLQAKLDGLDKFKGDFEGNQKKQAEDAAAATAGQLFDQTLTGLTSGDVGIKFDDADDTKEFEASVRDIVATQASQGKITDDAQFTKAIQDAARVTKERIDKRNQRIVTEYLKKKGQLPKEDGGKPKEKETVKSADDESIGDAILREMSASEKK